MLHIDISILWTIINLLILYWLLKKFLFGRVRGILKAREDQIKKSYDDAAAVQKDADDIKAQYEAKLQNADADADKIRSDARKNADAEYDRIVSEATDKSNDIIEAAKKKAVAEADRQKRDAEDKITGMVKEASRKIVASQSDEQMYDAFLNEVSTDNKDNDSSTE